jgi:hypothetical protein
MSLKETRAPFTKYVHLVPFFTRLKDIQPSICFASIKDKFPPPTFAGNPACFNSTRSAHEIDLSSPFLGDAQDEVETTDMRTVNMTEKVLFLIHDWQ